jgi:2-polyprenyl-3-methyl-5-hydroxy-6-metoxy-1,4-benzoquinol methylase
VPHRQDLLLLDAELREAWGIDVGSLQDAGWWELLERECPGGLVDRFRELHRAYVLAEVGGTPKSRSAEREFFDLVADERLLGRVHSHRRGVIIDTAAVVDDLVVSRKITGPMLDAGCHAGYLATWWARHSGLEVVGSDLSRPALELGRRRSVELGRSVELVEADLLPEGGAGRFELIVAVDVLPEEIEGGLAGLERLAAGLVEGGWLVLSTGHRLDVAWNPLERVQRKLAEWGLGFVEAGCLGGVVSGGQEPLGQNVFVLRRGDTTGLPGDCVEISQRDWPGFLEYASNPRVPDREKSQAWCGAVGQAVPDTSTGRVDQSGTA